MAGNTIQVGTDNKIRIKTNGIVVAGAADSCCCGGGVTCTNCSSGSGPSTYRVVITGWTGCTCAFVAGVDRFTVNGNLNGTWDLSFVSQIGNVCTWKVLTTLTVDGFLSGTACPGTPDETSDVTIYYTVVYFPGFGTYSRILKARFDVGVGADDTFLFVDSIDDGATKPDCSAVANFTNDGVTCAASVGGLYTLGTGGTASVTGL